MTTEHLLRKARKKCSKRILSLTDQTPPRSELNLKSAFIEYQPQFIVSSLILDVFVFCFFSQNPKPNKTFYHMCYLLQDFASFSYLFT